MQKKALAAAICCGAMLFAGTSAVPYMPAPAVCSAAAQLKTVKLGGKVLPVNAVVDKSVTEPKQDGSVWICPTISSAIQKAHTLNAENPTVLVKPGTYDEKLRINIANLTLAGVTDPNYTILEWHASRNDKVPEGDKTTTKTPGSVYGISDCATINVTKKALNFQVVNMTLKNTYDPTQHPEEKHTDSPVMTISGDGSSFWNCRFEGHDTVINGKYGRQYYNGCYIEGGSDIVAGGASQVFENCEIRSLMYRPKKTKGYITKSATAASMRGILFYKCDFTADDQIPNCVYLGRPSHPSSATEEIKCEVVFRECNLGKHIKKDGWTKSTSNGVEFLPENERMFEYKNAGPGSSPERRQILDADAANYTVSAFLYGWVPEVIEVK